MNKKLEEIKELVTFVRTPEGVLEVCDIKGDVDGSIEGETLNITIVHAPASDISMVESFYKDVKISKADSGINIECPLGLWSVFAPTKEQALQEAQNYYFQYLTDGEYAGI